MASPHDENGDLEDEILLHRRQHGQENYQNDPRFNGLVKRVAHDAVQRYGPLDPERLDRDAYRLAVDVALNVLTLIYEEDADLRSMRDLVKTYRKMAEEAISSSCPPVMILKERPL